MPLGEQANITNIDTDEDLYTLIQTEIDQIRPALSDSLGVMSTPGHDPNTLTNAINNYIDLTQRIASALDIAEIKIFTPLFQHLLNNLVCLRELNTPLTRNQAQPFKSWLNLLTALLKEPDNVSKQKKLSQALINKHWMQTIDHTLANKFYTDLQTVYGNGNALDKIDKLIKPPAKKKSTRKPNSGCEITFIHKEKDTRAYEALSINRNNAWLRVKLEKTYLLFPQSDIVTIETLEGLQRNPTNNPIYANLHYKNHNIPIYALSHELRILKTLPESYHCAIILKNVTGYFGILSEAIATHTTHQEIEITTLPDIITRNTSPIQFITKCKDTICYIIRSNDLFRHLTDTIQVL